MLKKFLVLFEHPKYGELLRFVLGGFLTTAVNFLIYTPCYYWIFSPHLSAELSSVISNGIAWFFAVLFAFFINKYLVFRSRGVSRAGYIEQILSFYAARVVSGLLEISLPAALISLGMNNLIAKLLVSVAVMLCNYLTGKFLTFRKKKHATGQAQSTDQAENARQDGGH